MTVSQKKQDHFGDGSGQKGETITKIKKVPIENSSYLYRAQ